MVENAGIIPEVIVVDATVAGVGMFKGTMRINLTIPSFGSDFPTNCSDFPDGMDAAIKVNESHRLELRRQNRVPGKGDGSKPFNYYWGINGRSEEPVTVFSQVPNQTSGSSNGLRDDPTGISIERQVAYKGAIELAVARIQAGATNITMESILGDTEMAAATIHGGPVVREEPESPEDEHPDLAQQDAFDNLNGGPPVEPEIGNLGDFLNKAMEKGHGASSVVLKKLGVKNAAGILENYENFDAAWKELVKP